MKLNLQSVSKAFGARDIVRDFSLEVNSGMRLALVGPNGCGKTTLMRIMAGESEPDSGQVIFPKGSRVGYAAQELGQDDLDCRLTTWVLSVLPSWNEFWSEWEKAVEAQDVARLGRLSERQSHLEQVFGYNPEHRAKTILSGLGFAEDKFSRTLASLSGGWRERAKLARLLVAGGDILFLDEPTNHLDMEAVSWLESYLMGFRGVCVFVAHERFFLDKVSTHVLFLGGSKPLLREGNFSEMLRWMSEVEAGREREAGRLSEEIDRKMAFVKRFGAKATKARQAQSRMKQVEKLEAKLDTLTPEKRKKGISFKWPEPKRANENVLSAVNVEFAFPDGTKLWPSISFNLYRGRKIALVGPNGSGKSTLLKLLMGKLKPTGGHVEMGTMVEPAYFSQHQTDVLRHNVSVLSELRSASDPNLTEEELRSVLGLFDLGEDYWTRLISTLSGGEKSRLVLAGLFLLRANLLVMDEPTNHLDLETREALIEALNRYSGTILLVAHDRYLLSEVADEFWGLSPKGLTVFEGGLDEYVASFAPGADSARSRQSERSEDRSALVSVKENKREAAEMRNRLYREIKPLKDEYARIEADLEKTLAEQAEAEALLADPATYEKPGEALRLNKAYGEAKSWSETLFERLAEAENKIKALEDKYRS